MLLHLFSLSEYFPSAHLLESQSQAMQFSNAVSQFKQQVIFLIMNTTALCTMCLGSITIYLLGENKFKKKKKRKVKTVDSEEIYKIKETNEVQDKKKN